MATGDVNGDGIPDLIIGACNSNAGKGVAMSYSAQEQAFPTRCRYRRSMARTVSSWTARRPVAEARLDSVATGDVNGDGIADLIIGAATATISACGYSVYVVFGEQEGKLDFCP